MLTLAIHSGAHDSCAAVFDDDKLLASVAQERVTRLKTDGGLPLVAMQEALAQAGVTTADVEMLATTRGGFPAYIYHPASMGDKLKQGLRNLTGKGARMRDISNLMRRAQTIDPTQVTRADRLLKVLGLPANLPIHYANHHFCHALPSLFFTDWDDALLYTADGFGDNVNYSHTLFREGRLENLYGDDRWLLAERPYDSVGMAYMYATKFIGFRPNRHEGKVTGLAAFGEPALYEALAELFKVDADGRVQVNFTSLEDMEAKMVAIFEGHNRETVAASIQLLLEKVVHGAVGRLVEKTGARRLGLAGGVFANVRLNRELAENLPLDEVFVVPPMGDDGLCWGAGLSALMAREGLDSLLQKRRRLDNVYLGRDYMGQVEADFAAAGLTLLPGDPAETCAKLLANGKVAAIYNGRMEHGPRALGARTILGSPVDKDINDSLNKRLARTEFMPFAPVVSEEDAGKVFDITNVNRYAARFMTITCGVKPEWQSRIPAVVHVDGTARPQIIRRADNPLYFNILQAFKAETGLPVLINTSFNAHEEPIINTPAEAAKALNDGRIDHLVTVHGVWAPAK